MTAILLIILSLIWYFPVYRRQGEVDRLPLRVCLKAIFVGMVPVFLCSILVQGLMGFIPGRNALPQLAKLAVSAFIEAGLVEELAKFTGAYLILKKVQPTRKLDYVLIFGGVGLGFHLTESLMGTSGDGVLLTAVRAVLVLHLLWQYWMAMEYFEYRKGVNAGDKRLLRRTLLFPILFHGLNDFLAFACSEAVLSESQELAAAAFLLFVVWMVVIIVYMVYIMRRVKRVVKESREAVPAAAAEETTAAAPEQP